MKLFKLFIVVLLIGAPLAIVCSSASAAVLTSPSGTEYTGTIEATLAPGSSALLKAGIEDTCTSSTVSGTVSTDTETEAKGTLESLSFSKCTKHTITLKPGRLTVSSSGVVTAFDNEVTVNDTSLSLSCVYGGGSTGTALGTLKGGSPAALEASTTHLKKISGSFFCSPEGTWTARYTVTTPGTLLVDTKSTPEPATLTSPSGAEYTGTIEATLAPGSSALLKAGIEDTCTSSTVSGTVGTNTETEAKGTISSLSFSSCTKDTTTLKPGRLTISSSGVVTAFDNEVTVNDTSLSTSCVYGGGSTGTALGTLKGGSPAALEASTTHLKKISGSFFCSPEGTWTARYTVTTPGTLLVDTKSTPEPATLTSPSGTEYTGTITATLESGTSALLKATIEGTCTASTVSGTVGTNTETHARGLITDLTFSSCTNDIATLKGGELTISQSGAVTATGNEVTINYTNLGFSCVYGGGTGTTLGTLEPGTPAKLKVNTTELQKISGGFSCPSTGTWTANYIVTTPGTLLVS